MLSVSYGSADETLSHPIIAPCGLTTPLRSRRIQDNRHIWDPSYTIFSMIWSSCSSSSCISFAQLSSSSSSSEPASETALEMVSGLVLGMVWGTASGLASETAWGTAWDLESGLALGLALGKEWGRAWVKGSDMGLATE